MRKKQITVIGSSEENPYQMEAYEIGRYIAQKGYVLISGGRRGIMEYVSKGAHEAGGIVVGILPGEDDSDANDYCDIVIPTGIGFARNSMNILSGDLIISIYGKAGTLTELGYSHIYNKPVICCSFTGGWTEIYPDISMTDWKKNKIHPAETLEQVFCLIDKLV